MYVKRYPRQEEENGRKKRERGGERETEEKSLSLLFLVFLKMKCFEKEGKKRGSEKEVCERRRKASCLFMGRDKKEISSNKVDASVSMRFAAAAQEEEEEEERRRRRKEEDEEARGRGLVGRLLLPSYLEILEETREKEEQNGERKEKEEEKE